MKVDQTIFVTDPKRPGNCVAACVATLLDVPLDRVPHFIEFGIAYGDSDEVAEVSAGNNWWAMLLGYLAGHGRWVVELDKVTDADPDEFVLVAGMSPRGVMHQVIYRAGRLWHDPHPSRDGVLDVREVLAVRSLPGFDHTPSVAGEELMSVRIMHRDVPYTGLAAPEEHAEAVRVAAKIAAESGHRMRVHQTPVPSGWLGWAFGWHICEVGTCRKEQA